MYLYPPIPHIENLAGGAVNADSASPVAGFRSSRSNVIIDGGEREKNFNKIFIPNVLKFKIEETIFALTESG